MSRHPAVTWTLRAVRAAQLAMLLLFVAYSVCVQASAVAYLAGSKHPAVGGAAPPVPLTGTAAAVTDIAAGLVLEAVAAFIFLIAATLLRAAFRERRQAARR